MSEVPIYTPLSAHALFHLPSCHKSVFSYFCLSGEIFPARRPHVKTLSVITKRTMKGAHPFLDELLTDIF